MCPFISCLSYSIVYPFQVYRALHAIAPSYIARLCVKQPVVERRYELRSAVPSQHDLVVQTTKTQFGRRSFTVAAPSIWNSLPDFVRDAESLDIFKARLKTHVFREYYGVSDILLSKRPWLQFKLCARRYYNYPVNNHNSLKFLRAMFAQCSSLEQCVAE